MNWKPSDFARLDEKEKAFVIACIDIKMKAEKEERSKLKNG